MTERSCGSSATTWKVLLVGALSVLATTVCIALLQQYVMPLGSAAVVVSASHLHLALAATTYLVLRFVTVAPYGRYAESSQVHVAVPAPLSWALQECPTLLNVIYYLLVEYPCHSLGGGCGQWMRLAFDDPLGEAAHVVADGLASLHVGLLLFVIHYVYRSLLYPLLIREGTPVPIEVMLCATLYCLFNGRLQLLANIRDGPAVSRFPLDSKIHMTLLFVGSVVFFAGMWVNVCSDYGLLRLKAKPPKGTRKIPHGGLFKYVSCANFFGEIVEWCGYTLVVWSTTAASKAEAGLAACSFFLYVMANLLPRGRSHHAWYEKHFGSAYKALRRRVVIPYLY
ncbi:3-oxo-5-alpha-steroid 4-dehydrogenase [Trypanosoma rangeli]|uniref:3-oxo-5-alpha-steroid 4-dehydrogenase n=1 Tax=Trypanosoma rangeli TaxID=5698 RepID=A0A3R7NDE6_TRYRA|nr:3-oxo-5-alpha-steroid 4-dehydrogenase [Trypanosoma rangeli]RNF01021.1 3-oxo-5-alpha-steroid 4-dehydrogenase [Trypanosoma rangeli]|eukprot:RNF01021.1 3-oxo-5-alpha-steroid 4-dehydrogenase [Trypanosoma rangeli]